MDIMTYNHKRYNNHITCGCHMVFITTLFVIFTTTTTNSQYLPGAGGGSIPGNECLSCVRSPCRKVTGIFTRPVLPLGYNNIATLPSNSCNITIREVTHSNNYLGEIYYSRVLKWTFRRLMYLTPPLFFENVNNNNKMHKY